MEFSDIFHFMSANLWNFFLPKKMGIFFVICIANEKIHIFYDTAEKIHVSLNIGSEITLNMVITVM